MAQLVELGAEMQTVTVGEELSTTGGSPSINTSIKRSGNASFEISGSIAAGATEFVAQNRNFATNVYGQVAFYIDSLDATDAIQYVKVTNTASTVTFFDIQTSLISGSLSTTIYYNSYGNTLSHTIPTLSTDTWYVLEYHLDMSPVNGSRVLEIKIDGVSYASSSSLTIANGTPGNIECGIFNNGAGSISGSTVYYDDILLFDTTGSQQNSWPGQQKLVLALPTGAGDNAADAGTASSINEIPPSTSTTVTTARIDLDTATSIGDYAMTDSSTLGISSGDTIKSVAVVTRLREETATTSGYQLRIKSASGGTVSSSAAVDGGNTTTRTNPNSTTAFTNKHVSYLDPTTGVVWTPTGTNSIDNMQVGVTSTTTNDIWVLWLGAYIAYVPASGVTIVTQDIAIGLTTDNTTITQDHVIAPQDIALALSIDNATITQNHVIQPQDVGVSLSTDNTTVDNTNFNVTVQDIAVSVTEDNGTVENTNHYLVVDDVTVALTEDATTIAQNHAITAQDVAVALSEDNTTVDNENVTVSPNDIAIGVSVDATTISQNHVIATADIAIALSEDNTTVANTNHFIAVDDVSVVLTEDNTTLVQTNVVLAVQDISVVLSEDNTTITQNHIVAPADVSIALSEDTTTVTETNFSLVVQDISVSLSEDSTTIAQNHVLTPQDVRVTTSLDHTQVEDGTFQIRKYYIDSDGNVYWVINQDIGLVEMV